MERKRYASKKDRDTKYSKCEASKDNKHNWESSGVGIEVCTHCKRFVYYKIDCD